MYTAKEVGNKFFYLVNTRVKISSFRGALELSTHFHTWLFLSLATAISHEFPLHLLFSLFLLLNLWKHLTTRVFSRFGFEIYATNFLESSMFVKKKPPSSTSIVAIFIIMQLSHLKAFHYATKRIYYNENWNHNYDYCGFEIIIKGLLVEYFMVD